MASCSEWSDIYFLRLSLMFIVVSVHITTKQAAFTFPTSVTSIAHVSAISASATCTTNGAGYKCNDTCPTRTNYPRVSYPLTINVPEICDQMLPSDPAPPPEADTTKGNLSFSGDVSTCPDFGFRTSETSFSLAVWIFSNCTDCTVLRIGTDITFRVSKEMLTFADKQTPISTSDWVYLVTTVRGTELSWLINGVESVNATKALPALPAPIIKFGPGSSLTYPDEVLAFVDAQIFDRPLTFREMETLSNRTLYEPPLPRQPDCRCPEYAPYVVKDTYPEEYLKCRNADSSKVEPRLNQDTHPAIYMIDKDNSTDWKSGQVKQAVVTLTLGTVYQLGQLKLAGLQTLPTEIELKLTTGGLTTSTLTFKSSCASLQGCKEYNSDISTSKRFSYSFQNGVVTRTDVYAIVADKLVITFKSDTTTFFTVSELQLDVRCHCFGNDPSCTITDKKYTCSCSSHTKGVHCDTCENEFYRQKYDDLSCTIQCYCNSTGRKNNICEPVGGQCQCKANVDPTRGRRCIACRHNTINFGSDLVKGCTTCNCTSEGVIRCEESNGACICKPNVDTSSGRCAECVTDYYQISNTNGCQFCDCDPKGTKPDEHCNKSTGQCPCRTNVQGKTCNECKDEFYDLRNSWTTGCQECGCNFVGSTSLTCNKTSGQCPCTDFTGRDITCEPQILSVEPLYGPMAGGTQVSIVGHLLGTGSVDITVSIDDKHQTIVSRNESLIVIETSQYSAEGIVNMAIAWAKETNVPYQMLMTQKFSYKVDPSIDVPGGSFKTYASGGCSFDFRGQHLTSVFKPMLMVYNIPKNENLKTICSHADETQMTCKTPNVTSYTTSGTLTYGFWLDNVDGFRDLGSQNTSFEIIPDPEIRTEMTIEFKNTFDKDITITGKGLAMACDDKDVRIMIGGDECPIKQRTNESIVCDPDESFPGSSRDVEIMVYIGNFAIRQGTVQFKSFWSLPEFIGIAVGFGVLVVILLVVVIICCMRRRRNYDKRPTEGHLNRGMELEQTKHQARLNTYDKFPKTSANPILPQAATKKRDSRSDFLDRLEPSVRDVVKSSIVDRTQIEPGQLCTQKGKKIRVIDGQFSTSVSSPFAGNALTIKTLISPYPETESLPSWLSDGLKECTRLQNVIHDNVLRLLGIAIDSKQVYVLYPEMAKRTLKDYLATSSFSYEDKLDMCVQVVEGMKCVSSEGIVHRDLAARNCWVDKDKTVKIADASFGYDLYPDEYLFQNGRHQPVRWMAPESLRQSGFYTSKSDVWSCGVLMWEVLTNGYLPYPEVESNTEISEYVNTKEFRLGQPHGCPDNAFSVIEKCQTDKSDERPSFTDLMDMLTRVISPNDDGGENMYQNQNSLNRDSEAGMELYENLQLKPGGAKKAPPAVPPKSR